MALLIDSSVLIDLERRRRDLDELIRLAPDESFALASITASEILVGVHRASPDRRQLREQRLEGALSRFPVLTFDLQIARAHAQLWVQMEAAGVAIGRHDLQIAATALAHGYDVLTENVREFERVPGLVARRPEWQ